MNNTFCFPEVRIVMVTELNFTLRPLWESSVFCNMKSLCIDKCRKRSNSGIHQDFGIKIDFLSIIPIVPGIKNLPRSNDYIPTIK